MKCMRILVVLALALSATGAFADTVVLNNVAGNGSTSFDETRGPNFGILAQIVVGGSSETVTRFGVFGNQVYDGNVAWAVFQSDGTRVYNSGLVAALAGTENS